MIHKDCFAYRTNLTDSMDDDCKCLKKLYCKTENCKFYKTLEQYNKDREKYEKGY